MVDPNKSLSYNITIQCSLDGFCFVVHDQEERKIVDVELYQTSETEDESVVMEALEKTIYKKDLYGHPLHSVRYIVGNRYSTLVPEEVFDETQAETYLRFSHNLPQEAVILHEAVTELKSVNVFAVSKQQVERLRKLWPEVAITHQSSIFLRSVLKEARKEQTTCTFVNVSSRFFEVAVVDNEQKLRFFNSFKFKTKDDFVYFLLFALEQQGLAEKDHPVYFTGLITNRSEIIQLCERYIRRIRFIRPDGSIDVDMSLNDTPFQYYYIPYKSMS